MMSRIGNGDGGNMYDESDNEMDTSHNSKDDPDFSLKEKKKPAKVKRGGKYGGSKDDNEDKDEEEVAKRKTDNGTGQDKKRGRGRPPDEEIPEYEDRAGKKYKKGGEEVYFAFLTFHFCVIYMLHVFSEVIHIFVSTMCPNNFSSS